MSYQPETWLASSSDQGGSSRPVMYRRTARIFQTVSTAVATPRAQINHTSGSVAR